MDTFSRFPFILNVSNAAIILPQRTNSPLQLPLLSFWQTSESAAIVSEEDIKPYRKSSISLFDMLFKLFSHQHVKRLHKIYLMQLYQFSYIFMLITCQSEDFNYVGGKTTSSPVTLSPTCHFKNVRQFQSSSFSLPH